MDAIRNYITENKANFNRVIDSTPAILTISALVFLPILAVFRPNWVAYFVTAYIVYYSFESVKIGYLSWRAYKWVQKNDKIDWLEKLNEKYSDRLDGFYQAIIIPYVRESESILTPTIENLANSNFPSNKIILVLAPEAAYPVGRELADKLIPKYKDKFAKIFMCEHTLVPGELKGKASNENNAARELYKALTAEGVDPKKVMVTSLDSDMKPDKNYLPLLTYKFFEEGKERFQRIFQPIPINLSKAWMAITPARLVASFGFQFYSALMQMPHRLINYSVYCASLSMIHDVGYWSPDVIPEDERFYWQSYFKYGEKLEVVPLFVPVYGDVIIGDSIWDAMREQYKQIRRWAWGATEVKFFLYNAIMDNKIPLSNKLYRLWQRFRTHFEWVFIPVIITFGNFLPIIFSEEYRKSPLAYMIPTFTSRVLTFLLVMFVVLIIMDYYFAPKKPNGWSTYKTVLTYIGWVMFPVVSFLFSAFPALEAQLRLLFNKPIVYVETKKK